MKRLLVTISLFFAITISISAQGNIDSLANKLRGSLSDSLRIRTLIMLSRAYQYIDLKKSFEECEKAVQLAETKNLAWAKSESYHWLSNLYSLSGDFTASAKYNDLLLGISFLLKDSSNMFSAYNNLGENYSSFGKYDEAYFYHTQSYRIASARKDSLGIAISLHNMARVFKELGQYARALDYLRLTQKISTAIHDYEGEAYNYDEIGDIYSRKGEYDSALSALKHSLKKSRSIRMKINELFPETLLKIAKTYQSKKIIKMLWPIMIRLRFSLRRQTMSLDLPKLTLGEGLFT